MTVRILRMSVLARVFAAFAFLVSAMISASGPAFAAASEISPAAQAERDEIYSLLAYAVVLKDWQVGGPKKRGHNIGSVLVDGDGQVVCWGRNSNTVTKMSNQHGEVRLIMSYLSKSKNSYLKEHVIYTTLEPCAMCSGMMTLTNVERTVWGQHDPGYGDALERLQYNSYHMDHGQQHGYKPYPRPVISQGSKTSIRAQLDASYDPDKDGGITSWLLTPAVKKIYEDAARQLQTFKVKHAAENKAVLAKAKAFLNGVPDHFVPIADVSMCPPKP